VKLKLAYTVEGAAAATESVTDVRGFPATL